MQFPDGKIEKLKQMFLNMDDNGDGTLSVPELKHGLVQAGIQVPSELEELLLACDTDGSGAIDYTEFLASTLDKKLYHQESVLWAAFQKFDLDNSGSISKKELGNIVGQGDVTEAMNLGEHASGDLDRIFKAVDVNGDGTIDFEEFVTMMRSAANDGVVPPARPAAKRRGKKASLPTMSAWAEDIAGPAAKQEKQDSHRRMWWEEADAAVPTQSMVKRDQGGTEPREERPRPAPLDTLPDPTQHKGSVRDSKEARPAASPRGQRKRSPGRSPRGHSDKRSPRSGHRRNTQTGARRPEAS